MRQQWKRMKRFEAQACTNFDHVVAVSDADAAIMRKDYGVASVSTVPTGVDLEYFAEVDRSNIERSSIVFIGSMDWMPNDDGIRWFVESVLPLIKRKIPAATITAVGRKPSAGLLKLAQNVPGLVVTGTVPDIRPYLERAAVTVVPLRIGGGTRLKIYEAMAANIPVVSTTIGAEGLPVGDGEHILIADDPEGLARQIVLLLENAQEADRISNNALKYVRENCGWDAVAESFISACI
jgi:glycosyltransferase involved in cell wall biosynthesis